MFCSLCGQHVRHAKSPVPDLRRKECPRFPDGVIHRGCCAKEVCSDVDERGRVRSPCEDKDGPALASARVRCMWEQGGRERLDAALAATYREGAKRAKLPSPS